MGLGAEQSGAKILSTTNCMRWRGHVSSARTANGTRGAPRRTAATGQSRECGRECVEPASERKCVLWKCITHAALAGEAGDAEAPDGVGEDVVGARVAARPTAGGQPKLRGGPRIERGRPPDGVAGGPPVASGDGATGGTC